MRTALTGRELLTHPFYLRWEAGELAAGELAEYAVQYRAFEAALPAVLTAVAGQLRTEGNTEAATLVEKNLADELGRPEPHLALFDRFAEAVGGAAGRVSPGPAADALVATYFDLVGEGPAAALAGLAAYETQASAIASSKADGLRRWYGVGAGGHRVLGRPRADGRRPRGLGHRGAHRDGVGSGHRRRCGPAGSRRLVGAARRAPGRLVGLSRALFPPLTRTKPSRRGNRPDCG